MTKVHRVEMMVIDDDEVEDLKGMIEGVRYPNRSIAPEVVSIETREVEWSDDHPLNQHDTWEAEYRRLFSAPGDEVSDDDFTSGKMEEIRKAAQAVADRRGTDPISKAIAFGWDVMRQGVRAELKKRA